MLHEQQQTILMRSNVWEWTHFLLVNTPCSHLHSLCATGVSSGLATMVTLTRMPLRVWESQLHRRGGGKLDLFMISFLYRNTSLLLGCVLNGTPRTSVLLFTFRINLLIWCKLTKHFLDFCDRISLRLCISCSMLITFGFVVILLCTFSPIF
jgi:hypothetical protein